MPLNTATAPCIEPMERMDERTARVMQTCHRMLFPCQWIPNSSNVHRVCVVSWLVYQD